MPIKNWPLRGVALASLLIAGTPASADGDFFGLWPFAPVPPDQVYPLPSMSCAAAIKLVDDLGAAQLADARGVSRRYVAEPSRCRSARAQNAWVSTRDLSACAVGFTCEGFFGAY